MGCYGIGVTRTLAAIAETSRDDKGMIWSLNIAPYKVIIVLAAPNTDIDLRDKSIELYDKINNLPNFMGEIIIDDRDENPGVKMREALLLGIPVMIVVGAHYRRHKKVEIQLRKSKEKLLIEDDNLVTYFTNLHQYL